MSCNQISYRTLLASVALFFIPFILQAQPLGARAKVYTIDELKILEGKVIGSVSYNVRPVFEPDTKGNPPGGIYRAANSLKTSTQIPLLELEFGIKSGDVFNPFNFVESARRIRQLKYLRNMSITPVLNGDKVDIVVDVQDAWTLIPQVSYSTGTGDTKKSVGLSESNLGGYAKRAEILYRDDSRRSSTEFVFQDERFMLGDNRFLGAYYDRSDGQKYILDFGKPFRKLTDENAWNIHVDNSDTIGRLYYGGDERYIYRGKIDSFDASYSIAKVSLEEGVSRYTFGWSYDNAKYSQATSNDYDDLDLDPSVVSNDNALLPEKHRYTGPSFGMQFTNPQFISLNYVDRFDRIEDFNLGLNYGTTLVLASKDFGSTNDAAIVTYNRGRGVKISDHSFARGEFGFSSRAEDSHLEDTIIRAEARYYNVLGPKFIGATYVGRHTFAISSFVDYGRQLDRDREFLIGGDNALRGYKANTFSGDKRFAINLEDRIHLAEDVFKLMSVGAVSFIDIGGATTESFGSLFQDKLYGDAGFGLRLGFPRSSGGSVVRLDVALPFREGPDGSKSAEFRILFGSGQLFNSKLRSESVGAEEATISTGLDR
jgi:outer membrane protein assembly factor BamA